jgi:3-hydroxyacyl-CoA dehydrogenase
MISHGVMPQNQMETCRRYLTCTIDTADLTSCDVIFECIAEDVAPAVITSKIASGDLGAKTSPGFYDWQMLT